MLKIYEMLHSPYCIPITMILRSAGQEYESIRVPNWDRSAVIELTGGNYYQVPVLVHNGRVVYEESDSSLTVAHYVDEQFMDGALFPDRISGTHEVLISHLEDELEGLSFKLCDIHYIEAIADLNERTNVRRHKERKFGRGCVDRWRRNAPAIRAELMAGLNRFRGSLTESAYPLTESAYLFGDQPVYADYALAGVIGNYLHPAANELDPDQDWLRAWLKRLQP